MRIWRSLDDVPGDLDATVISIGNFDGVHLGHRAVLRRARELADDLGHRVVAVTFSPHPIAVLRPDHAPPTLTEVSRRCALLAEAGVDDVLVIPFSREVAGWPPEEFVQRVVVDGLRAAAVVVGANFRFGARAGGDVPLLRELGRERGFVAEGIELDGGPQVWSSTYVRTCLAAGDVEGAAEALGRPFAISGQVVRGDRRGRELGYPTANVSIRGLAAPADGVYAGRLRVLDEGDPLEGRWLPAAISVGTNPTFEGERERRVEAYVLPSADAGQAAPDPGPDPEPDLDLYDRTVEVTFLARIRGMVRFEGVEELLERMALDVARTRELLEDHR